MHNKNLISTEDWSKSSLDKVIELALVLKKARLNPEWRNALSGKTFVMLFYNQSLRTHLSFETAIHELGGHSIYRTPQMGWIKNLRQNQSGEDIRDAVEVIGRYAHGLGIRITLDAITEYGEAHKILQEYAQWSKIPIINMADDMFHPCQALADIMTWSNWFHDTKATAATNALKGKNLLLTWGKSGLARPWSSVQSHLLMAARYGMNITLAYPQGYDLDPHVISQVSSHCTDSNATFNITNDPGDGYEGADVVYVRNWITKAAYSNGNLDYEHEISQALSHVDWTVTQEKMNRTENAVFSNPMPIDRGLEAENSVIDSTNSLIYEVAENRLHVQKAILSILMGNNNCV